MAPTVRREDQQNRPGRVTTHSFRKTVATLIDEQGLSARVGADHLGHAKISMTQDVYMTRGKVHTAVAELLGRAINDE
jgi:integrase